MKPIALSPLQTYVYPIMNKDGIKISLQTTYGGEKSESLPCGFVTNYVYEQKQSRRSKKNANYRRNQKAKALGYKVEKKISRSLASKLVS